MKLKSTDTLEFINRGLTINGKPFVVENPDEPILGIEKGKLVTIVFRGCGCSLTHWEPEDIEGHFPEEGNEGW
jgi:hypothetical protein